MILAPLTRWWVGQFLYGNHCVVEVKEIDPEDWLKIWILNGHYHCWYDPQTLELRFEDGGPAGSFFDNEPLQEIVQIDEGQYWPAIDGQHPPWETPPDDHDPVLSYSYLPSRRDAYLAGEDIPY